MPKHSKMKPKMMKPKMKNGISAAEMKRLKTHSKMHKGRMASKHMKNMKKFMKMGDSFILTHNKAVRLDGKGRMGMY